MRINTLIINNYKNIDFDLFHKSDLIALIGNNGSGKSNTLEAISFIFRSLYVPKYELNFDYCINYTTSNNDVVQIIKQGNGILFEVNSKEIRVFERNNFLPKKVIAIYSGEETRLFDDCYGPFYREFVSNINKAQLQGTDFSELPKMLFLNRFYWNISLLCLLLSDDNNIKDFIDNKLSINRNTIKIKFDFLKRNYENYNDNQAIRLIKNLDKKTEYSLQEFKNLVINDLGYIVDEVYKYLYLAYTPKDAKVIHDIMIEFNNSLTVSDLSEGEKKLILIKGALSFAGHEDCLFLLDEPDSHVHINNKEQIINSFSDYLQNRQIVITTHSPTLTQSVKDENVYMLNNGKIIDIDRQKIIQEVTGEFWNKHQQSSFLSSEKSIFLIVEGKEDKEHLKNAYNFFKDEYENLSFVKKKKTKGWDMYFTLNFPEYAAKATATKIMQLLDWEYAISNTPSMYNFRIYLTPRADVMSRKFEVIGDNKEMVMKVLKGGVNCIGHSGLILKYQTKYLSNWTYRDPDVEVIIPLMYTKHIIK